MKIQIVILLTTISLVACAIPPAARAQTTANDTAAVPLVSPATPPATSTHMTAGDATEAAEIRGLVETFGKRLQNVSLLSPNAGQELKDQYSEFVSPALLEEWVNDVSKAPGRRVSSPWPDHIEITTLLQEGPEMYEVAGSVVEVTSLEVVGGGTAAKVPVRIVVQKGQGGWLITEYTEEQ